MMMGHGKPYRISKITDQKVVVRDYGRGIPLRNPVDGIEDQFPVTKNDDCAFQKSVGLNG